MAVQPLVSRPDAGLPPMEHMSSISPNCNQLKRMYDACFNEWFSEKFLKGSSEDDCAELFRQYKECVRKSLVDHGIDCDQLEETNTIDTEKAKPTSGDVNKQ